MKASNPLVAIGCGQFALSIMQVMFMFYYVKIYMNTFHVPQVWFNIAQFLFMVWNAVNDPLFGYMQDSPRSWLNNRTLVIKYFAPFLVCSFVFMWIPWSTSGSYLEGVHLILALFLYDAFYSCISVAWSALFADTTKEPKTRVAAMKYSQISILLSVNIIAITEKLSNSLTSFGVFQAITVVVACVSYFCMHIVGSLEFALPFIRGKDDCENLLTSSSEDTSLRSSNSLSNAWILTKEIVKDKNFAIIMGVHFMHTARSVAHMNFASTATELLISQEILPKGSLRLSMFYICLTIGPQLLLILNEKIVVKYGASLLLKASYIASILSGFMYIFATNSYMIMIFMVIDSITVHSAAPLFNIIISDFVDDDAKRNCRRLSLSSLIFSLDALFVKPAQSLAPVFIVYFLNAYGYSEYTSGKVVTSYLGTGMMYVLFGIPLILGSIQYLLFAMYSLTSAHKKAEMVLSVLLAVDSIKASVPCALLSSSMIPFATISFGIGSLSWVIPKKLFLALDNSLYKAYMRLCLFVFENLSGVQLKLYGDVQQIKKARESALVLSNHQSNVDWAVIIMLADRQGEFGSSVGFRVMVKQAIHYVPLFGWYIFQHGYIYVRRFGTFIGTPVLKQLTWLDNIGEKYWLLLFPEGTRYTLKHSKKIAESKAFCQKMGFHEFSNVLCPRVGGMHMAIEHLTTLDAVYDVTVGYGQTRKINRRGYAPGMFEFVCGTNDLRELSVHVRRYSISEIPKDKQSLRDWMMNKYEEKDKMLDNFYETGEFPEPFEMHEPALPLKMTLPGTLFFTGALAAPFYCPEIKQLYFYTIASFPLLIVWLKIRKCV